ncbi:MAG: hypothetical protein DMF61_27230 [Blastocatellia bacterium AA13]|nr:MAG: hypothetical protein DMF61_27230 [Blastocatellia bacterium AA13]
MSEYTGNIFDEIERKFDQASDRSETGMHDSPQWMRRCFMTGKQCIFCPHETVFEKGEGSRKRDSVFIIMPFESNLETFFEWSLRPYLKHFKVKEDNIRRADQFANTGYVMCEKICLRIQQAGFVVVDLSLYNPNVYYELGMAVGLNKPLLAVCDASKKAKVEKLCRAIGINSDEVLYYPNVGYIDVDKAPLLERIQRVKLEPRKTTMKTLGLLLRKEDEKPEEESPFEKQDIHVSFPKALEAAVGVAMRMLEEKHLGKLTSHGGAGAAVSDPAAQLAAMLSKMQEKELKDLRGCVSTFIMDEKRQPHSFEEISRNLNSALITIVDLVSQDALSYFWLGYCHARNINIIPVYREESERNSTTNGRAYQQYPAKSPYEEAAGPERRRRPPKEHILAFDIRALWYMWHKEEEAKKLAEKLAAVFEPILLRDVATQQRRIFWERLTRSGKVLIYNGAVHHQSLNREVVGDWDLRTASELISYLSSTDESVMPDLKSPLYSPETIAEKLGKTADKNFLRVYAELVKEQLKGKNCLIVASADVNPITEIILANVHKKRTEPACFVEADLSKETSLVIAFKGESPVSDDSTTLPRHFCRVEGASDERGFYIDGHKRSQIYYSQDKAEREFQILAHLVVARNPFSEENVVVILNGVSGPATYGLAQLLTGAGGAKASASEKLLKEINEKWANRVEVDRKFKGVEAIVSVSVSPTQPQKSAVNQDDSQLKAEIDNVLFDKRAVGEWKFLTEEDCGYAINIGNPREFPNN